MQLNAKEIMSMLPHKAPFLFVDKIIECIPGQYAVGIKNVTIDQPFFQGHFPADPILPGVLIVESIAQVTAVMYGAAYKEKLEEDQKKKELTPEQKAEKIAEHVGYLAEIKSMKFKKIVEPGDVLRIEVTKKGAFSTLSQIEAKVTVEGAVVVEGKISVSEKEERKC